MPSRYIHKVYAPDAYYHVYNRGVGKRTIFKDSTDYAVFLNLLKRHLSINPTKDKQGRVYPNYHAEIDLLAFCLMPNHFHLFVFQSDKNAMTKLLRSICVAYTMYFNRKYRRVGPLFQSRFKASIILDDVYLQHISRYIHLNPPNYINWEFSSLPYYLGKKHAEWINPQPILGLFENNNYLSFLEDYEKSKEILDEIKSQLASS